MRPTALLPLLMIAAAVAVSAPAWLPQAHAQAVHRCTDASGAAVFTDRRCEDVGAASRVIRPRLNAQGQPAAPLHLGCPRKLSDLVQQITGAIDANDANRLAALYQWNGISDASANRLLDQMETIVRRPLVDIAPIFPAVEPTPVLDANGQVIDANADGYFPTPSPPQKPRPVGLRLQQTLANTSTPSSTVLGIRRSYDCFWITL
ncbi:hypothetical protein SAMN05428989_0362 [Pseudoxanthomonas sp. GM95]|uniref:DUF4124 domain-containing protein n=1 Tax=Pseudoxanthomonas sp. GM95 TaxID=1881043 RepID=UPI0008C8D41A|nr:DUF4124 domain-containing protein [Pseudoxanthomonas sp. GM95]SEK56679.1 hypothetical protein SAMN05428989_0362 [Pseudoxanthomonas sp. GM95]